MNFFYPERTRLTLVLMISPSKRHCRTRCPNVIPAASMVSPPKLNKVPMTITDKDVLIGQELVRSTPFSWLPELRLSSGA